MNDKREVKTNFFDKVIRGIEVMGNKLPNPFLLFMMAWGVILILSQVLSGISAVDPATGEKVMIVGMPGEIYNSEIMPQILTVFCRDPGNLKLRCIHRSVVYSAIIPRIQMPGKHYELFCFHRRIKLSRQAWYFSPPRIHRCLNDGAQRLFPVLPQHLSLFFRH